MSDILRIHNSQPNSKNAGLMEKIVLGFWIQKAKNFIISVLRWNFQAAILSKKNEMWKGVAFSKD